ncbi:MAG: type II secretion system major pseudopilin GspG [Pseudomonadota bacterium]
MRVLENLLKRLNFSHSSTESKRRQAGYSLLEILVVLAIMAVLATLVAPRLFNQVDRSKVTTAKAQARSLKTSLDAMRLDMGRYPTSAEGLSLLTAPPDDTAVRASWFGPYVDGDLPVDPWGNPYRYFPPQTDENGLSTGPRIVSYGADNAEGGDGLNQDIEL